MTRKGLVLVIVLLSLVGIYSVFFSPWTRKKDIPIFSATRPNRPSSIGLDPTTTPARSVGFGFDKKYRLTSVKVVAADDLATNKYPQELWHLIADTQSIPIKSLTYGQDIKGMKPSIPGRLAEPLEAQVKYVLMIETKAGQKGQIAFFAQEAR